MKKNLNLKNKLGPFLSYASLIAAGIFVLVPIIWMVITSLKTEYEALEIPPTWLPRQLTFSAYYYMWKIKPLFMYLINSVVTSGVTAAISILIGAFSAYAVSRFNFRFRKTYVALLLVSQMIPGILLVGPYYKILTIFGLLDTRLSLILGYTAVALPFCTWMLKSYFDSIPKSLDEAALVDGYSRLNILFVIVLPLSLPGIVATATFGFLLSWGDLLWAMCLTTTEELTTVALGIANMVGEYRINWPAMMSASLVSSIPSIVLYLALQRFLVAGMTAGGVKE